jgi:hypothetical protein
MRPVARAIPLHVDPGIAVSAGGHVLLLALLIWGGFVAPRPLVEMGGGPVITVEFEPAPAPADDTPIEVPVEPVQPAAPSTVDPVEVPPVIDESVQPVPPVSTIPPTAQPLDLPPDRPTTQPPAPPVDFSAPTSADRPVRKPDVLAPTPEPQIVEPVTSGTATTASTTALGRGPTEVELVGLKLAISDCWNLGTASTEALRTTVTVLVDMRPDGTASAVTLLSSDGASARATDVAFKAAQSAIFRCAAKNKKPLASDRYDDWRQIEMTFDPSKMR